MKTKTTLTLAIFCGLLLSLHAVAQDFPYISFGGHTDGVRGLAFSADGTVLASGSDDASIIVWEVSTGNKLKVISNLTFAGTGRDGRNVYEVSLNPDGTVVASAGSYRWYNDPNGTGSLRLWEVSTGNLLWQQFAESNDAYNTLAVVFSPDGTMVASGGDDHTVDLWDATTGDSLRSLAGHTDDVFRIAYSVDGQLMASCSNDKTVRLWEATTGRYLHTLARHTEPVYGVAISPDGLTVASGSGDGTAMLWDVTTGRHRHTLTGHEGGVGPVAISSDGTTVASGGADGTIRLWEVSTGRHLHTLTGNAQAVHSLVFSPTEQKFASGHEDGNVFLWELPDTHVRIMPETVVSSVAGEQFTIDINVEAGVDINAYEVHLMFDATAISYVSAVNGDYLPAGAFFSEPVAGDNTVILTATSLGGTSNGAGKLATVTFEVLDTQDTFIDISRVALTDGKDREVHLIAHSTKIEAFPVGDVNRDKVVNIQDMVLVAASFGQPIPEEGNPADVNGDGTVNIIDLVTVAGALGNKAAAAPMLAHARDLALTRADVERWLTEAQQFNLTDATAQRGIRFLEQLLAVLTPQETALLPNYPNPFNPETWIPYQLAEAADVSIAIYAANGQLVRTLTLGYQPVGVYQHRSRAAYWDGKNGVGEVVASGVYFYTFTANDFTATRKMLILK